MDGHSSGRTRIQYIAYYEDLTDRHDMDDAWSRCGCMCAIAKSVVTVAQTQDMVYVSDHIALEVGSRQPCDC